MDYFSKLVGAIARQKSADQKVPVARKALAKKIVTILGTAEAVNLAKEINPPYRPTIMVTAGDCTAFSFSSRLR